MALPAASGEGDIVDNPPPVRNTAEARRYSGQKIAIYALILGDALDDAIARRFTRNTGIQAQIVRTPTGVEPSGGARFEFFQRLPEAQSPALDALLIDVIWPGALASHLVDLNPKLGTEAKQHYPAILQNNTINGRLIGMPCFGDFGMLYYRTDLLQKYGSTGHRTWEQLEQQAPRIVEGEKASKPAATPSRAAMPPFMRNWPYAYALWNSTDSHVKGRFDVAPLPRAASRKLARSFRRAPWWSG